MKIERSPTWLLHEFVIVREADLLALEKVFVAAEVICEADIIPGNRQRAADWKVLKEALAAARKVTL